MTRLTGVEVRLNSGGGFVKGQRTEMNLSLTDATFGRLAKIDFSAAMPINAPPGSYEVCALVRDELEGKLTAVSETFQIK